MLSWELEGCSEVMGLVAAGWHWGQAEFVPLCVQCRASGQCYRECSEPAGKNLSLSRTTSSHGRTPAFPYLMSHKRWNFVIPCVDARVTHSNQLTFHWTVVNFAWLTLKTLQLCLWLKLSYTLFVPCPLCRSPWLLSWGCLGQSPRAGLRYQHLLPLSLQNPAAQAFVSLPEFYFTIETIPSVIWDLHQCWYKTNKQKSIKAGQDFPASDLLGDSIITMNLINSIIKMHLFLLQKYGLDKGVWLELHIWFSVWWFVWVQHGVSKPLWVKPGFCYLDQWYGAGSITINCSNTGNFILPLFYLTVLCKQHSSSCRK